MRSCARVLNDLNKTKQISKRYEQNDGDVWTRTITIIQQQYIIITTTAPNRKIRISQNRRGHHHKQLRWNAGTIFVQNTYTIRVQYYGEQRTVIYDVSSEIN